MTEHEESPAMRLAKLVNAHRGNRRVSDIALAAGLSQSNVRNVLRGEGHVPFDKTLRALSTALDIPMKDIFEAAGKPVPVVTGLVGVERLSEENVRDLQQRVFRLLDEQEARHRSGS
jgi:transcriptional regulator with XRE-family HTH domain